MDNFEERRARDHSNNNFLPPFLGGPIDEIFLRGAPARELKLSFPELSSPVESTKLCECAIQSKIQLGVKLEPLFPPGPSGDVADKYNRTMDLHGMWVCVGNVPVSLFHLIYYFFTQLGTLETIRAYDEQTFYLLYKYPRDTLRALGFHRKRVIFLDQVVFLTCSIINPLDMELINSNHCTEDTAKVDPIDPQKNKKSFVFVDDNERKLIEELDNDTVNGNDDEYEDDENEVFYELSEYEYIEAGELVSSTLLRPNENKLKYWLFRVREWAKMRSVALKTYITYRFAALVNYVFYCLQP